MQTFVLFDLLPAMAVLPVVVFLAAVLLLSFPAEGKVKLKWKIQSYPTNFVGWQGTLRVARARMSGTSQSTRWYLGTLNAII